MGDWGQIGYSAPGSKKSSASYEGKNFDYTSTFTAGAAGTANDIWTAEAKAKLNDCESGKTWTLTAKAGAEGGSQQGNVGYTVGGEEKCRMLTPAFDNLAKTLGS